MAKSRRNEVDRQGTDLPAEHLSSRRGFALVYRPMTNPSARQDTEVARAEPVSARLRRGLVFAINFIKHPKMVGTFAVSSPALVQRLLAPVDWSRVHTVVELGPGVGTITRAVLDALPAGGRLIAVEMNSDFVRELRRQMPDPRLTVVHGSAADLERHLATLGLAHVDLVISGIPFSTMPPEVREQTLDSVAKMLNDKGEFLVYQYSRQVGAHLENRFDEVDREREWRNLVPIWLYRSRRARVGA